MTIQVQEVEMDYAVGAFSGTHSNPWKMFGVDGKQYIVKFAVEGEKTAINELLCFQIAKELDLPVFNPVIAIVSNEIATDVNNERDQNVSAGKHFAVEVKYPFITLNKFEKSRRLDINDISNIHTVLDIAAFDAFIFYDDRHAENVCIVPGSVKGKINYYIFDHDLAFRNSQWNFSHMQMIQSRTDPMTRFCLNTDRVERMAQFDQSWTLIENLRPKIDEFLDQLPQEWTENLSQDMNELRSFLVTRSINILKCIIINSRTVFPKLVLS